MIQEYVRTGQLRLEFRPFGFVREWSTSAGPVRRGPRPTRTKLFEFVKAWYANQGSEDVDYVDDAFARDVAGTVEGLDAERLVADAARPATRAKLDEVSRAFLTLGFEQAPAFAGGKTGEALRPIDLGSSPQTASAAISGLINGD